LVKVEHVAQIHDEVRRHLCDLGAHGLQDRLVALVVVREVRADVGVAEHREAERGALGALGHDAAFVEQLLALFGRFGFSTLRARDDPVVVASPGIEAVEMELREIAREDDGLLRLAPGLGSLRPDPCAERLGISGFENDVDAESLGGWGKGEGSSEEPEPRFSSGAAGARIASHVGTGGAARAAGTGAARRAAGSGATDTGGAGRARGAGDAARCRAARAANRARPDTARSGARFPTLLVLRELTSGIAGAEREQSAERKQGELEAQTEGAEHVTEPGVAGAGTS